MGGLISRRFSGGCYVEYLMRVQGAQRGTCQADTMTSTEETAPTPPLTGSVKWFDPAKGFGFIVSDQGGPDILLHANVLRNFGQGSVADGSGITVQVQQSDRGLQALEVLSIVPPAPAADATDVRYTFDLDPEELMGLPIVPARVKWFDKVKGFGFANAFGDNSDVFVQVEVLRRSGLSDLQAGEAIGLRVTEGDRGKLAVEIVGWETVQT